VEDRRHGFSDWPGRARAVFAGGVTHDVRYRDPPGPYFVRGAGPRKWDDEGREYVDFVQGHGALLLGIAHAGVAEAVAAAAHRGSHLGGNTPAEVEWAERIVELVPCAERVRFTASGTEATLLALRLARIATGRDTVVRLEGHFHGWHDYVLTGVEPPFELPVSPGIPEAVLRTVDVVANDADAIEARLARGDVAALILEPSGASWGTLPLPPGLLERAAAACPQHGTLLVLDEVITGFRVDLGGAQRTTGVVPDLCTLGKVMAGGFPGGAVAGRAELFEPLELRADADWNRKRHVYHPGTFNANPVSAAAGLAALGAVEQEDACARAAETAAALREELAGVATAAPLRTVVYGESSWFHVVPGLEEPPRDAAEAKGAAGSPLAARGERLLLDRGVDTLRLGGFISSTHGREEIGRTAQAFAEVLGELARDDGA
jgi:glutamate-1-semialdehyde 2,1-aminomutase